MKSSTTHLTPLASLGTLLLASVSCAAAQQHDRAAVERTVRVFFDSAVARFDYERLDQMVTYDAQVVEAGRFMDVAAFKKFIAPLEGRATLRYVLSDFRTRIAGDVAWTSYRNNGVFTIDGVARDREWHEAMVLVRRDARWLIDLVHSQSVSR